MGWELVGQGGLLDAYDIRALEESVEEGKRVALNIDLSAPLPTSVFNAIKAGLQGAGVPGLKVTHGSFLRVEWRKGFHYALIVIPIILALVLAIMIVGWKFFKEAGTVGQVGLIIAIIIIGAVVLTQVGKKKKSSGND